MDYLHIMQLSIHYAIASFTKFVEWHATAQYAFTPILVTLLFINTM